MTRILLADDHAIVRRGLRSLMETELPGVTVDEADDARAACGQLMAEPYDLLILDLNMPGRSGLEVLEEVRRLKHQARVLVLSGYAEEDFAIRALQLGAAGYLNKHTAFDEIIKAVRRILGGGRYVTASLAERLAATLGGDIRQEPHDSLSNRELQVLRLIARGRTLKEIAGELTVSEKTVATYRARISEKMRLGTKVELVRYALQHRLAD